MNEFDLIARYFTRPLREQGKMGEHGIGDRGIGDDCAVLAARPTELAITTDMLVEDAHFLAGTDPEAIGHKSLAVNLSDLAAAGAAPRAFFLALALPRAEPRWLEAFAKGLFALADQHQCRLLGGDTVRAPRWRGAGGPLTISITALGDVDPGGAFGRGGARPGDDIWVSGELGDALVGLLIARGEAGATGADAAHFRDRMERPVPRVRLGLALRGLATSAIDVSDGFAGDLGHILERSGVGAEIDVAALPRSAALGRQPQALQRRALLAGGDDYELVFTAAAADRERIAALAQAGGAGVALARVGSIRTGRELILRDEHGARLPVPAGFDHFVAGAEPTPT